MDPIWGVSEVISELSSSPEICNLQCRSFLSSLLLLLGLLSLTWALVDGSIWSFVSLTVWTKGALVWPEMDILWWVFDLLRSLVSLSRAPKSRVGAAAVVLLDCQGPSGSPTPYWLLWLDELAIVPDWVIGKGWILEKGSVTYYLLQILSHYRLVVRLGEEWSSMQRRSRTRAGYRLRKGLLMVLLGHSCWCEDLRPR